MHFANVPMSYIGPVKLTGHWCTDEVKVPLATFESPLWSSTNRGARVTRHSGGIAVSIIQDFMARSITVEAPTAARANQVIHELQQRTNTITELVSSSSRFAKFHQLHTHLIGNLLFIRLECSTGDAAGHNMVTKAAEQLMQWIITEYPDLQYVSLSGNYCTDKKVSAVNSILGRGKYVIAECIISRDLCASELRTTPEKIVNVHLKKNLIGSVAAGSLHSANAHFANILLAVYLATGQDAANIVEGSQGMVHAEVKQDALYFSVTLPNVIVGTVGSGKNLDFVQENLQNLGCMQPRAIGDNSKRLAAIVGATVLCGELSLLAALTNPDELMRSHLLIERERNGGSI